MLSLGLAAAAGGAFSQAPPAIIVPVMTPVYLKLGQDISSNKNKPGDRFPIEVAEDVRIGDTIVIPAGSPGEGEVVHAAKSGAGGKAGELILAARFIRVGDVEVRLRSFALGAVGKDHSVGALATSFVAGPFAMFVHGGVMVIPRDTQAGAKTAIEVQLPAKEPSVPAPQSQPIDTTTKGENNDSKTS